ncbi:hypothetical protein B0H10DRAFT_2063623 [Mycena sp. CBHHK59/15]|nr:hypothetical protein B0H10DRAFT_2063623 [Mycena sp. CBHHK59/15]
MVSDASLGVASEVIRIVAEPNTFVVIAGTALGGYTQRVTVIGETGQWQLTGEDKILLYTNKERYLRFLPEPKKRAYILLFEASKSGNDFADSEYARDFKSTKKVIPNFATYYTIHTEDGGDTDYHDVTLTVALIGASKAGVVPNGVHPGGDDIIVDPIPPVTLPPPSDGGNNVTISTGGTGNPDVSVTTSGTDANVSVTTQGPGMPNVSVNTPGGNVSVTGTDVGVRTDADGQPIPTGSYLLRNVYTNCDLTAVLDTSPAMMFLSGQVPVEWRTWRIAVDGNGRVSISNHSKTSRYLQDGATLVDTTSPNPVRLIRALTETEERY